MVYMYHSFLVHSSADGHLGCFHVLAIKNIYLFLAMLDLHCCPQAFSGGTSRVYSSLLCGLFIVVDFLVAEHGLQALGLQ